MAHGRRRGVWTYALSAPNSPFFACVVIPELDGVISPQSDGSLLGSVNRGSGGALGGHNRARSLPHQSSYAIFSRAASGSVAWEYPFQWPSQTSPP